jgi:energy-coupling factor transporter ATP-binding protein EcfA2
VNAASQAGGAELALAGVGKRFQARDRVVTALEATTLTIENGEFVTLVGPSGCGKSTLLNIISGLTFASEGSVRLDGKTIKGLTGASATLPSRITCSLGAPYGKTLRFRSSWPAFLPGNGAERPTTGWRASGSMVSAMLSRTNCQEACASAAISYAR